ncbi:hypothetical protein [Planococcus lenghuensis]|uniref:Uncharacterized protein n=1 Tax=Planococcus lenghuensis TaxID=2213202 RepID=A0A1Q2L6R6_9BACL|nr:hypothetical protein [Planococcus lenghuensis]AQQ55582.1 hypothetical protein B0X71_20635 [Planococcus lenghuensis]
MSEQSNKGPLIQKKSSTLTRPKPVVTSGQNDFKFSQQPEKPKDAEVSVPKKKNEPETQVKTPPSEETEKKKAPRRSKRAAVGKNNNVKSVKVPHEIHVQIGVLGKFMDENKTYAIISELIDNYVANQLTDRQQKQFEYMTDFFNEPEE